MFLGNPLQYICSKSLFFGGAPLPSSHMWGWETGKGVRVGAPGGTRTHNLLIRSQALYPLSYGGVGALYQISSARGEGMVSLARVRKV